MRIDGESIAFDCPIKSLIKMNLRQQTISKILRRSLYLRPQAFVKTLMKIIGKRKFIKTWKIEKFWWTRGFNRNATKLLTSRILTKIRCVKNILSLYFYI
ncbi:MAG: hypothetical protein BWK78_07885 [Thiotrichaceae bacterium IS1]|nr:MAG: hypothetical protein BWK78_07885 [Thiotrichaceae bacterium IS1]